MVHFAHEAVELDQNGSTGQKKSKSSGISLTAVTSNVLRLRKSELDHFAFWIIFRLGAFSNYQQIVN
jgi:hypothetical protein